MADASKLGAGYLVIPPTSRADDSPYFLMDEGEKIEFMATFIPKAHVGARGIAGVGEFKSGMFETVRVSQPVRDAGFSRGYVDDEGAVNGSEFNPDGSALMFQQLCGSVVLFRAADARKRASRAGTAKKAAAARTRK